MREASFQKIMNGMALPGLNITEVKTKMRNFKFIYYRRKKLRNLNRFLIIR